MSATELDATMIVTIAGRRFQVYILQDGPASWFGVISEQSPDQAHSRPLGYVETNEGADVALHGTLDQILQAAGVTPRARHEIEPS